MDRPPIALAGDDAWACSVMKRLSRLQLPLAIRCVELGTAPHEHDGFAAVLSPQPAGGGTNWLVCPDGEVDLEQLVAAVSRWIGAQERPAPPSPAAGGRPGAPDSPDGRISLIPVVSRTPSAGSLTAMAIAACTSRGADTLLLDAKLVPDLAFYHDVAPETAGLDALAIELAASSRHLDLSAFEHRIASRGYSLLASHRSRSGCPAIPSEQTAALLEMVARSHRVLVADLEPPLPSTRETGLLDLDELNFLSSSILHSSANLVVAEENTIRGRFMAVQLAKSALAIREELANLIVVVHEVRVGRQLWAENPEPLLRSALAGELRRTRNFEVIRLPAIDADPIHERVAPIPAALTGPLAAAAGRLATAAGTAFEPRATPLDPASPIDLAGYLA